MCGIAGVIALEGRLDPSIRGAVPAMTMAIRHRGPDGDGFFSDDYAVLGHRRLAIIDLAGGAQPIANEDETVWLVFNGEIYNYHALHRELESRGHVFRTRSDTETILHAYEEFGPACLDRLEGMFAFAIYDGRKRELFLTRDRLGKKPMFYAVLDGVLHFASEIKAFRRSPAWRGDIDLTALEGYLSLGYFLAPDTIYRGVRKLEPGHWLRVSNGAIEVRKYWDVERFDDDDREEAALLDDIEPLLGEAVRDRLESEVPLGAFLSGGIDSGLVVSFMAESVGAGVTTASVGFGETAHNELDAARLTATHFDTRHHAEVIVPALEEVFDPVVAAFDEPLADSSAIPTYYVARTARQHVTVALTGDGGDETFGGYDFRYVPHAMEERVRPLVPGQLGRRAARWAGARWPRAPHLPKPMRLGNVLENLGHDPAGAYYLDLCFLKPGEARALLGLPGRDPEASPVYDAVTAPYRRCPSASAVQRAQYADLKVYLPNDPLVKVDRVTMAHALEVRCPLLDRRLVEMAFRIPTARKLPGLRSKHLLRRLAERRLPSGLASAPKRGFTAPIGEWIAGRYAAAYREEVLDSKAFVASVLDQRRLRAMFDEHCAGGRDHSYVLWAVWMLERWSRLDDRQQRIDLRVHQAAGV
jgi:asparagine synthase (glutamine-hydrolysing)